MTENPTHASLDSIEERARARRNRITGNRARSFQEAEDWDLEYWQAQGPAARLSALVALRKEVGIVQKARESAHGNG